VSWISLEDKYYLQKEGQDLRQKVDSAVNNFVQIHFRPLFLCAALTSRIYKNGAQTSACGAAFSGYEWSIPMFRAKIPHFTSKIVEHSRHLPPQCEELVNSPKVEHLLPSRVAFCPEE
jgi:hypothetical protein